MLQALDACRRAGRRSRAPARRRRWSPSRRARRSTWSSSAASFTFLRERADVIERAGEGDQPVARDAAVGRRDADHAAERRRLADGAAGVRAERDHRRALRHHRRRAAARAARHAVRRHGIAHRPEGRVLVGGAHGELVAVGLAEDHAAGLLQAHRRPWRRKAECSSRAAWSRPWCARPWSG